MHFARPSVAGPPGAAVRPLLSLPLRRSLRAAEASRGRRPCAGRRSTTSRPPLVAPAPQSPPLGGLGGEPPPLARRSAAFSGRLPVPRGPPAASSGGGAAAPGLQRSATAGSRKLRDAAGARGWRRLLPPPYAAPASRSRPCASEADLHGGRSILRNGRRARGSHLSPGAQASPASGAAPEMARNALQLSRGAVLKFDGILQGIWRPMDHKPPTSRRVQCRTNVVSLPVPMYLSGLGGGS